MRVLQYALLPVFAAAVVSCGGDGALTGPGGALESQGALAFAGALNNNLPAMPSGDGTPPLGSIGGLPNGAISTSSVNARALGCETVTGNAADADGDNIVVSRKVTYNCTDFVSGQDLYSITGSMEVIDKNDSGGAASKGLYGGYRVDLEIMSKWKNDKGTNVDYKTTGVFDASRSGTQTTFVSNYKTHFTGTQDAYGQLFEINYKYQTDFTAVYTRTNATDGTVQLTGLIGIDGQFPENGGLKTAKAVMEVRSNNLTYRDTCPFIFNTGDVEYVDGAGNILSFRYNCGAAVKYFLNGQALN